MTLTPSISPTVTVSPLQSRPYLAQISIDDASGHQVLSLPSLAVEHLGQGLSLSAPQLQADGQQSISIIDAWGVTLGTWNGTHADGGLVAPGVYRVRVDWSDGTSFLAQASVVLVVLPAQNALARSLQVAPNPVGRFAVQASLRWVPDGKTDRVRGHLYNLAGELVSQDQAPASAGRLDWNLRSGSGASAGGGIYLWEVDLVSSEGRVMERKAVKFVVIR